MCKRIIVSAHGGRYVDDSTFDVPEGTSIYFYQPDNEQIGNDRADIILEQLRENQEVTNSEARNFVEMYICGMPVYKYKCWYASEFPNRCGIYQITQDGTTFDRITPDRDENNPLSLEDIVVSYRTGGEELKIFWLCCRSVDTRNNT